MVATLMRRAPLLGRLRFFLFDRYYNTTIRIGLIAVCLVLTLLSALLLKTVKPADPMNVLQRMFPVLLLAAITIAALMYRYMEATGVAILIVTTALHEGFETGSGTKLTFAFALLMLWAFVWLFKMAVVERKISAQAAPANRPALLFMLTLVLSWLWSNTYVENQVGYLFVDKALPRIMTGLAIIISIATYFLYSNFVRSEKTLKWFVWWFVGVGAVFGIVRLLELDIRVLNSGGQFPAWVTALALGQALFNTSLSRKIRIGLLLIAAIWAQITVGLGISWLSGWLPLVIVVLGLLAFRSYKLILLALVVIALYAATNTDFIQRTFLDESGESGNTRSQAWARTFEVVRDHALLGTGPAGYHFYFTAYGYFDFGVGTFNLSHNNYVDIIAQTGVIGFSLWILFWVGHGITILRLYLTRTENLFLKGLKFTLIAIYPATLLTMMLGDWITPFPYTQTLAGLDYTIWAWMFAGLAVALSQIIRQQNAALSLQPAATN